MLYTALHRLNLGSDLEVEKIIGYLISENEHIKLLSSPNKLSDEMNDLLEKLTSKYYRKPHSNKVE